ncbi:histidine phosphatase family protein [Streptomyces sp. NBC_01498]|uniref:histidine phosphatase family protein n=1 Tax=Streptomyces sp. NBC_01498 TaxID=2975870 RepID=UPI002E7BEFF0|nr:histidine phosphatase family protein [Streptomyces sp. NBC_01498]WTL25305.1 histidine phosphatase family protein [Streptomyces sp. NBC_01498]
MTTRVTLISPALSTALREARFGDGPLDPAGLRAAEAARDAFADREGATAPGTLADADGKGATAPGTLADADGEGGGSGRVFASPAERCRQTAAALGLAAEPLDDLRSCAMGRWHGRRLDEVAAAEPEAVAAWLVDPAAAPHGGEPLESLITRLGRWLDGLGADGSPASGRLVAVAEPDVVRALTVHALGAAPGAFWRLDVLPLTATELSGRNGRWNVRVGRPL